MLAPDSGPDSLICARISVFRGRDAAKIVKRYHLGRGRVVESRKDAAPSLKSGHPAGGILPQLAA